MRDSNVKWALIIILLIQGMSARAQGLDFYTEHNAGWHWYRDPALQVPSQPSLKPSAAVVDPIKTMQQLHVTLNRALDRAILYPTPENIKSYMALQQFVTERTTAFTERWKEVLLTTPSLDYSITHPTSSLGREIYLADSQHQEDAAIQNFAKSNGLFFFYRGDCPYCHRFAPILKDFTEHYGINVIPISLGGGFLPEFPQSRYDAGQAATLHVQVYPSVFSVDPLTRQVKPVAFGLLSEEDLRERIFNIASHFKGESA